MEIISGKLQLCKVIVFHEYKYDINKREDIITETMDLFAKHAIKCYYCMCELLSVCKICITLSTTVGIPLNCRTCRWGGGGWSEGAACSP